MATENKRGPEPVSLHIDKRAKRLLDDPISDGPDDELLTTRQVAEWLGCSEAWLEISRMKQTGPPFVVISPRMIRYRRGAVREWLRKRERRSTAQYGRRNSAGARMP